MYPSPSHQFPLNQVLPNRRQRPPLCWSLPSPRIQKKYQGWLVKALKKVCKTKTAQMNKNVSLILRWCRSCRYVAPGGGIKADSSAPGSVVPAVGKVFASTAATSVGVRHSLTAVIVMSAITSSTSGSADGLLIPLVHEAGETGCWSASETKQNTMSNVLFKTATIKTWRVTHLLNISPKVLVSLPDSKQSAD